MLQKLRALFRRRPRLDDADPAIRRQALEEVDDQSVLTQVFEQDADASLKRDALARISDLAFLETCLNEDDFLAWPLKADVIARIDEVAPPNAVIRHHPLLITAAIATAEDATSAAASLALFENPNDLAKAILGHPRVQVRKAITETIWNPDRLRALENHSRGHDKAVNRIAKLRLVSLKEAQAEAREFTTAYQSADASARALDAEDPHYVSKRQAIEVGLTTLLDKARSCNEALLQFGETVLPIESWQSSFPARHESPPADDVADASEVTDPAAPPGASLDGTALEVGPERSQGETEETATGEPQAPAIDLDALAAAVDQLENPGAEELDELENRLAAWPGETELSTRLDTTLRAFRRSLELAPKAAALLDRGREEKTGTPRDVTKVADTTPSSTTDGKASTVDDATADTKTTLEGPEQAEPTLGERFSASRTLIKRTNKLIQQYAWPSDLDRPALLTQLDECLDAERKIETELQAEVDALVTRSKTDLDALDQSLEDGNVQSASRIEHRLRDTITVLPGAAVRPFANRLNDASARLRRLRDWRDFAVGPKRLELIESMEALPAQPDDIQAQADTVKSLRRSWNELGPLKGRDRELKERFDAAAERAFEACRAHYRVLAEQRQKNLAERRSIVSLLDEYIARPEWRDSDCRDIERVLRTARSEWRRFHPVDRQAGRDVERAFNTATETIYEALKTHWAAHESAKQNIIDRAETIATSVDPVEERARSIVDLQAEWKNAGVLPRHRDQKLYTRFRVHCDAVFEDRTNLRAERDAEFKASEAIVHDLAERMRATTAADPIDEAAIRALRKEAQEIDRLPRKLRASLDALFDQADAVMIAAHLERERRDQLTLVETIRAIDAELVPSLDGWEARAGTHADWFRPRVDGKPNDEDGRTLVIEAEIAAEIDSPEDDRQLRLSVQVEKLNVELGRIDRKPADPRDLLIRWCGAPVNADPQLRDRFFDAVQKLVATD